MAKLIFSGQGFAGQVYELMLEKTTIGRGDQNTLVIRDKSLSSTHCEILMNGPEIIVRDLDSSNGTFVNGARLNKQGQLKSGQTVRFGAVEARLELDPGRDDTDTAELTAVYSLQKIQREQRRAQKNPKPDTASMHLEPENPPSTGTQTILIPRPPPQPVPAASAPTPAPAAPVNRNSPLGIIAALVALALLALFWWLSRRH
jgi:predicted component of type VI protein secretion system